MRSKYKINERDMVLVEDILKYRSPSLVPLSFKIGDRTINGIPAEFSPKVHCRILTANTVQYVVDGTNAEGVNIRAEYLEYRDYPVTEWVVYITNNGSKDTMPISEVRVGGDIACKNPVLEHGNGDTLKDDGLVLLLGLLWNWLKEKKTKAKE